MIAFLSCISKITLPCLVSSLSLLFHSDVGEWSFLGDIDTGVVYSRRPTYLDSACADCTEANTLSQAHIHWLEIRCGLHHISHKYLTSISQALTSQYLSA